MVEHSSGRVGLTANIDEHNWALGERGSHLVEHGSTLLAQATGDVAHITD